MPIETARRTRLPEAGPGRSVTPTGLRIAGAVLRELFIASLLVLTLRVSMPQNETLWTAYETPSDVVRMALGLAVCIFIVTQLFRLPKDPQSYRIWLVFGLAAVPFTTFCIFAIW